MTDNQGSRTDRRRQEAYEARSLQIQQHLWHLQEEYEKLAAERPCIPDFAHYDAQQVTQLDAHIRASIDYIRDCISDNNRAVSDWDALDYEYRLQEDRSRWAQNQLRQHAAYFEDPSIAPSLYFKFCELTHLYQDGLRHLEPFLQNITPQADPAGRPAPGPLSGAATSASATLADRPAPGPLSGAQSPTRRTASAPLPPATAAGSSSASAATLPPNDDRRHFYAQANPPSLFGAPSNSRPVQQGPTQVKPSFRGGRTFTNSAFRRSDTARPTGIMTSTDGNIADAIPMTFQQLPVTATLRRQTPTPSVASAPLAVGTPGSGSNVRTEDSGSNIAQAASSVTAPGRSVRQPTEAHRRSLQRVLQNATGPAPTIFTAGPRTAHSVAAGRGSSVPTSGPLSVGADGRPFNASSFIGPHGSTDSPADFGEDFSMENSSAFYRKATYHRAAHGSTAPSPLVLKELPITPFEGNIREYPKLRNRFLHVVEAHPNLAPRQKLQYLLQFLRGEPHQLANNFQITDTNYFAVINLLEERYGNVDMIRNQLMQNLIQIRPPTQSVTDLRRFHDEAFRLMTELKQLGDDVDANRLYEQTLMAKLPPTLKIELIRHSDYAEKKTVSSIIEGLRKHTQILELTNATGLIWSNLSGSSGPTGPTRSVRFQSPNRQPNGGKDGRTTNRSPSRSQPRPGGYAADADTILVADIQDAPETCTLCKLQHSSAACTYYITAFMRLRRVRMLNLCPLCLGEGHRAAQCPRSALDSCQRCPDGQHHKALCPQVEIASSPEALRRRTVSPPSTPAAPIDSSGDDDRQQLPENQRHSTTSISVSCGGVQRGATDRIVPPSALSPSGDGNLNIIQPTLSEEERTTPKGRQGTTNPMTSDGCESLSRQHSDAFGNDRLLSRRSLWTDRSSPRTNHLQNTTGQSGDIPGTSAPGAILARQATWSAGAEEGEVQQTRQSRSQEELDDVNRFDKIKAVQYRSRSSSGGSDETEGLASTTISTRKDQPCALPPSDAPTVILECIRTTAISPSDGQSRPAMLLFDSGSTTSCISPQLVKELNLPRRDTRTLTVGAFGSSAPMSYEGATVSIDLLTREDKPLRLNILTTPCGLPPVRAALISEDQLTALRGESDAVPVDRTPPDIMIGQDLFHLFEREPLPRLPHGFAVINTILGPTLSGARRVTPTTKKTAPDLGCSSPLLDILDSAAGSGYPSPQRDILHSIMDSGNPGPLPDDPRTTVSSERSSPMLDTHDSSENPACVKLRTPTSLFDIPGAAETSFHWSEDRPPTGRDRWTRHWALLYFYHANPLDTDPEQEHDIVGSGRHNAIQLESLLATAAPSLPSDAAEQEAPTEDQIQKSQPTSATRLSPEMPPDPTSDHSFFAMLFTFQASNLHNGRKTASFRQLSDETGPDAKTCLPYLRPAVAKGTPSIGHQSSIRHRRGRRAA